MKLKISHSKGSVQEDIRYTILESLEKSGKIATLEKQPKTLSIEINNIEVFKYTPDFKYYDYTQASWVYEEYKGFMRDRHDSLLRMKCASAQHTNCMFMLYTGSPKSAKLTRVYSKGKAIRQTKKK